MTLADRRPLTNAYEPPLPAVRRWSICGAGLGFGPQSSQTGSKKRLLGSRCAVATADRRLVGTGIATMPEEGSGILSGDAVERGSERLLQRPDGAHGDPPQRGFHLGPARFNRAQVRAVARQVARGKA